MDNMKKVRLVEIIQPMLLIFIIIIILGIIYQLYFFYYKKLHIVPLITNKLSEIQEENSNNITNNITYNRCNTIKLQENIQKVFDDNGIVKDASAWDIYMPCGYNYVEGELESLSAKQITKNKRIFAISGCDKIASKNNLWKILRDYYGREGASTIMPESYIINDKKEMKIFKENYQKGKLYLVKKNIQRKEGIIITGNYDRIISMWSYKVIQEYVPDLYVLKNRKINIRLYLLVVCYNGKVGGYLYNQGKCIYTNKDYDESVASETKEREVHLTSVNLDTDIYKTHPETLDDLERHLGNPDYSKLWNNILNCMKKTMKASEGHICHLNKLQKAVAFQVFGGDIIFDKDFHPYLLELNKGPSMKYITEKDKEMKDRLTRDIFSFVGLTKDKLEGHFIRLN